MNIYRVNGISLNKEMFISLMTSTNRKTSSEICKHIM